MKNKMENQIIKIGGVDFIVKSNYENDVYVFKFENKIHEIKAQIKYIYKPPVAQLEADLTFLLMKELIKRIEAEQEQEKTKKK